MKTSNPLFLCGAGWLTFSVALLIGNLATYAKFFPGVAVLAIALYTIIIIFGLLCFAAVKGRRGQLMKRGDAIAALTPAIAIGTLLTVGLTLGAWTGV